MTYLVIEALRRRSPSRFDWRPLRRVASLQRRKNLSSESRLLALSSEEGVIPRAADGGRQIPSEATVEGYWLVSPGDLVFNPMWAIGRGVAVSDCAGAVSTAYRVYRPSPAIHPRYLHYYMRCNEVVEQYALLVRGLTTFDRSVTGDDLDAMPVPVPPMREQRAIADFLNRETARIDALIAAKERMIELLEERVWAGVLRTILMSSPRFVPLRRAIHRIVDGPFGSSLTSAHYSEDGARVVRLGNIGFAEFLDRDKAYIPLDHYAGLTGHHVAEGDLLIAGLGDSNHHVGRACVAPDLGQAIVKADCYAAAVDPRRARADFLALYLSSPHAASQVAVATRGSTRSRINLEIARDIRVPLPALAEQDRVVDLAQRDRMRASGLKEDLRMQIDLLAEHRQALITAAVTGELEVAA